MGGLDWPAIAAAVTVIGLLGGYVWRLATRLTTAETQASAAALSVAQVRLQIDALDRAFVQHRVDVAEKYVSKETLSAFETRIVEAINQLGNRIDQMFSSHK